MINIAILRHFLDLYDYCFEDSDNTVYEKNKKVFKTENEIKKENDIKMNKNNYYELFDFKPDIDSVIKLVQCLGLEGLDDLDGESKVKIKWSTEDDDVICDNKVTYTKFYRLFFEMYFNHFILYKDKCLTIFRYFLELYGYTINEEIKETFRGEEYKVYNIIQKDKKKILKLKKQLY